MMAVNFGNTSGALSTPPTGEAQGSKSNVKVKGGSSGELAAIMAKINKESGAKSIMIGSQVPDCTRLPTGVFEFDLATGGGFPDNRMSIVYGIEGSGKTNLAYKAMAMAQRCAIDCNKAVLVDLEGCVSEDSRFLDMGTGRVVTARQVFEDRIPLQVRSYDDEAGHVVVKTIDAWFDNGIKQVLELQTATSGLRLTENHKVLVRRTLDSVKEWVRADEVEVGWYVARPHIDKAWEWPVGAELSLDEARLVGYLLGDGTFPSASNPSPLFCNIDPDVLSDVRRIADGMGCELVARDERHHCLRRKGKSSKWHPYPITQKLKTLGLYGVTGTDKYIPTEVFNSSKEVVLEVLTGLYLTDGTVSAVHPILALSNTSLELMEQVRELWRRLGVMASLHTTKMYADHHSQQYILSINTSSSLRKVAELMPLLGVKAERLRHWSSQPPAITNKGHSYGGFGGLVWDKITAVDHAGEIQTYDFTVMGTHNYVVNDLVAHNTFDPKWAAQFGIDTDELLVAKPSYGEQAVDMVDALVRASDVRVLVLDSIAVLVAAKELEGTVEKADVGTAAILVKRLANKLAVALSEEQKRGHSVCVILLNQTRFKIGTLFGDPECLHGDTLVNFVDGRSLPIRQVVEQKLLGPVWAFNEGTQAYEPRNILSHHLNGEAEDGELLTITSEGPGTKNGVFSATVSVTHKFLTDSGWKPASVLDLSDRLVSRYSNRITGATRRFLLGAACGDLTLTRQNQPGGLNTSLKIEDSENPGYAEWKVSKLPFEFKAHPNDSGGVRYYTPGAYDLTVLAREVEGRNPLPFLSEFSWWGFSVWMMDDGHLQQPFKGYPHRYILSIGRYKNDHGMRQQISQRLNALGLHHFWKQDKQVVFTGEATARIASEICKYVPECMQHKLPPGFEGKYVDFEIPSQVEHVPTFVKIHSIAPASKRKYRNRQYYDIHVEGLNNYSVGNLDGGFTVHNTMPGGQTVKFNSSLIVRLYGKNKLVKEISSGIPAFKETNVTIKKAKVGITQVAFSYDLCMLAHDGLGIGDTDSFNAVKGYLQAMGALVKDSKSGWNLLGVNYPTLSVLCDTYRAEADFANKLHQMIVKAQSLQLVAPEVEAS